MTTKKQKRQETTTTQNAPIVIDANPDSSLGPSPELKRCLKEVNQMEGVLGYILKNDSTATINLKDSQKTVEYALLTSQAFDAIKEFSNLFSLGKLESATIECATLKVVLVKIGEYTLNVFMGKTVEPQKVLALLKQFTA